MRSQNPFPPGALAVVAVPLGNPGDVTARAVQTLADADLVAAEDTRTARKLLRAHGLDKPLVSYHDWNEAARAKTLLEKLDAGLRVALVSEAGTPSISDPGFDLVRAARRAGRAVFPVPGACALTAFLSVSGLPTDAFSFFGFPPNRSGKRKNFFAGLADRPETLVFYESPRRIAATLADALEVFGDREAALGREMTKPYEEFLFGPLTTLGEALAGRDKVLGEFCWGVRGLQPGERAASEEELDAAVAEALAAGTPVKQAAKGLSGRFGLPAKTLYARLQEAKSSASSK